MKHLKNDPITQPILYSGHLVPGIWQYLLPKGFLEFKAPDERQATCLNCPKIASENFRPDYRCCTYHPRVPNYALGLALGSDTGRTPIRTMIKEGLVLPEGSLHTPHQWYDYLADSKEEKFGSSERVLCHLLDPKTGYCNIYAFRNSVCSTFFCINDNGERGGKYWAAVETLVGQAETVLSQWTLEECGFDFGDYVAKLNALSSTIASVSDSKNAWRKDVLKSLFGKWFGREEELFLKCAELISVNRDDLWQIAGNVKILDASQFESAQIKNVPKNLKSEIEPDDYESGDAETLDNLWRDLKRVHKNLWRLPEGKFKLNPKVCIVPNDKEDREENYHSSKPYVLQFLTQRDSEEYDWRLFLSKNEKDAISYFTRPRSLSAGIKRLGHLKFKNPEARISEWYGLKVLRVVG